jgi:uncharacterized protein
MATDGAPERFDLRLIEPQPWKNGAGLTREIAVARNATTEAGFDWRLSVAEVTRDAPFSAFAGVDRCIVLLRGAGLRLRTASGAAVTIDDRLDVRLDDVLDHHLDTPFAPFHFPGDVPLHATLIGGASSDFNVMARRGAWRAEVTCHHAVAALPPAAGLMVLACAGEWQIGESPALTLRADQGLLWREPHAGVRNLNVRPTQAGRKAVLLVVRLCHDQAS